MDDLALPQHHRSGAHRARRNPLLVLLLTLGAVGLLSALLLWALLTLDVLGVGDELHQAGGAASSAPADPSATPSSATPSSAASQAAPSALASTSDEAATRGSSGEPEDVVERALPLDVLNSTATPGLAASAAAELVELGWTTGEVAGYGADEIRTTVFYPELSQQGTATAVAEDLGVGSVTSSRDVTVITVVLGPDYPG